MFSHNNVIFYNQIIVTDVRINIALELLAILKCYILAEYF